MARNSGPGESYREVMEVLSLAAFILRVAGEIYRLLYRRYRKSRVKTSPEGSQTYDATTSNE